MDFLIFQKINSLAGKYVCLDALAIFFAKYLGYVLVFIVFLFLLKNRKKYWPMVVTAFASAIFARLIITELIRFVWQRPRPFVENHVNLLLDQTNAAAFPSGHAAFFFALSTAVFLYFKKVYPRPKFWWGTVLGFLLASFLISISRVFVGIHWPSDIIAGALVGIFSGWLVNHLLLNFFKK